MFLVSNFCLDSVRPAQAGLNLAYMPPPLAVTMGVAGLGGKPGGGTFEPCHVPWTVPLLLVNANLRFSCHLWAETLPATWRRQGMDKVRGT